MEILKNNNKMSYYYKYNFISPESIYAIVKEELKSYFDTGAIDDLLFPTYLDKCLKKLGRSSYTIIPYVLIVEDFEARLPDNFYAIREAWACTEIPLRPYTTANSFYSQAFSSTTIQILPVTIGGQTCENPECATPTSCGGCSNEITQGVYKTNYQVERSFRQSHLLKPGNVSARSNCFLDCANIGSSSVDTFDIKDNKFVTNFRNGVVHLLFYGTESDIIGNQLVPDNYRITEYIEAFIKYKMFELLTNQTNDETFNQLQQKMVFYKSMSDEAYIMAESEIKKQTAHQKVNRIKQQSNSFNKYQIANTSNRRTNLR